MCCVLHTHITTYKEKVKKNLKYKEKEGLEEPHSLGTDWWVEAANRSATGFLVVLLLGTAECVGMEQREKPKQS